MSKWRETARDDDRVIVDSLIPLRASSREDGATRDHSGARAQVAHRRTSQPVIQKVRTSFVPVPCSDTYTNRAAPFCAMAQRRAQSSTDPRLGRRRRSRVRTSRVTTRGGYSALARGHTGQTCRCSLLRAARTASA